MEDSVARPPTQHAETGAPECEKRGIDEEIEPRVETDAAMKDNCRC